MKIFIRNIQKPIVGPKSNTSEKTRPTLDNMNELYNLYCSSEIIAGAFVIKHFAAEFLGNAITSLILNPSVSNVTSASYEWSKLDKETGKYNKIGGEKNQTVKQYLVQNRQRYIDVILANSIGFLEADLTENIIKGNIIASYNKTKVIPIDEKIIRNENNELVYSDFEKWWAERYIISNKEEFIKKTSIENIISCYKEGQNPVDVFCTMDIDGLVFDCKESFFVYEDEFSGNLCVFSIVYDLTEENRRKRK